MTTDVVVDEKATRGDSFDEEGKEASVSRYFERMDGWTAILYHHLHHCSCVHMFPFYQG